MKNNSWETYIKIPIKELSLWDENARFPEEYFNKSEEELIAYFLENKKLEIEKFAKEIVEEFDIPQFEPLLVLRVRDKNIVLEGNRRLTVYKLLSNPLLASDSKIQAFFMRLQKLINIDGDFILYTH